MCEKKLQNYSEDIFSCLSEFNDFQLRRSQRLISKQISINQKHINSQTKCIEDDKESKASTMDFNMIIEETSQTTNDWLARQTPLDLSKIKVEENIDECPTISLTVKNMNDGKENSQKMKISSEIKSDIKEVDIKKLKIEPLKETLNEGCFNLTKKPNKNSTKVTKAKQENKNNKNKVNSTNKAQTKKKFGRPRKTKTAEKNSKEEEELLKYANYVAPKVIRYHNSCPIQTAQNFFDLPSTSQSLLPPVYPPHFTQQLIMMPNKQLETNFTPYPPVPTTYLTPDSSQFDEIKPSPSTPTLSVESLQDFFDVDEIFHIFDIEKILYRLTERHVRILAATLNKDVDELFTILDKTMESDEDATMNELSTKPKLNIDTFIKNGMEISQPLIQESPTKATKRFFPSQRIK